MDPTKKLRERVQVATTYSKDITSEGYTSFPAKMVYKGKEIVFTTLALGYPTQHGHKTVHVYNMSDGTNDYRLEFDAENLTWWLTEITEQIS